MRRVKDVFKAEEKYFCIAQEKITIHQHLQVQARSHLVENMDDVRLKQQHFTQEAGEVGSGEILHGSIYPARHKVILSVVGPGNLKNFIAGRVKAPAWPENPEHDVVVFGKRRKNLARGFQSRAVIN